MKTKQSILNTVAGALTLLASFGAIYGTVSPTSAQAANYASNFAQMETRVLSGAFYINPGEVQSLPLDGVRFVQKLFIQAEARSHATTINVLVNGDVKGTLYLPASDPSYVVTINESVKSIEFQNIGSARGVIQQIHGLTSTHASYSNSIGYSGPRGMLNGVLSMAAMTTAAQIAADAMAIVDQLEPYITLNENATFLMPIKKTSARLYAIAQARGDLSNKVGIKLIALRDQIDFAAAFLDQSFERDATFSLAISLLALREQIDAVIQ